jgi:hypothetical protein
MLLVDDPPVTGRAYRSMSRLLTGLGVPETAIVLLVALCGTGDELPSELVRDQTVVLPWTDWTIRTRLHPDGVRQSLTRLLGGRDVQVIQPDGQPSRLLV